jgi:uncharacterized damage-inducible protein DinB
MAYVEPWMRGYLKDFDPVIASVMYSLQHVREDVVKWTETFPEQELWSEFGDVGSVGFHVRHIAGSIDRLMTYARGEELRDDQFAELKREKEPDLNKAQLLALFHERLDEADKSLRAVNPATLAETRYLGRKRIPVPLGGLLVHVAEHSQRHVGELIVTVKLVRGDWR